MRLVLDTDVVVAGLISPKGASRRLLELAFGGNIAVLGSVALFLEYEAVVLRPNILAFARLDSREMANFLSDLATVIEPVDIHFLWRPMLADAADEMVLETAVNGQAEMLVTFNLKDFDPARGRFNRLKIAEPRNALREIERKERK